MSGFSVTVIGCKICKVRPAREGGMVCEACMGMDREEGDTLPIAKPCKRCGEKKTINEYHRTKFTKDGTESTCKSCKVIMARANREKKKAQAKTKAKVLKVVKEARMMDQERPKCENADMVDLSGHKALLDRVRESAEADFRPLDWEVAYLLHKALAS